MNSVCRSPRSFSAIILLGLMLTLSRDLIMQRLPAATRYWVSGSSVWSNPNNWRDFPDNLPGVPQNGDTLIFEDASLSIMTNDLTGLVVASLQFGHDDLDAESYHLRGNSVQIHDSLTAIAPDTLVEIECPLIAETGTVFRAVAPKGLNHPAQLRLRGSVELNGDLLLQTHYAGEIDLTGTIVGIGDIFLPHYTPVEGNPALRVKLNGTADNTFVGSIIMEAERTLELDKESAVAVPGPLYIGTNCQVSLKRSHQIADVAKVAITAGGRFRLEGNTETIGSLCLTNLSGDTLAALVITGGSTLSVLENITADNDATSVVPIVFGKLGLPPGDHAIRTSGDRDWALSIEAQIIGDGGFTKTGDKGLLLSGDNSFNGDAVLQEGTVDVSNAHALGGTSGITIMAGGELDVRDVAIGGETLLVNSGTYNQGSLPGARFLALGTCSWAGPVVLNTNLSVGGWDMVFAGPISGSGGIAFSGFIQGAGMFIGTVQFNGAEPNTYTGPTLAEGPLLEFNKASGVQAFGGPLIVGSGSGFASEARWLQNYQKVGADVTLFSDGLINLNNHSDDFGPITFNSGTISTGTGELGVYGLVTVNPSAGSATIDGRLGLPSGFHEFRVSDGSVLIDLGVNAAVVGSGTLVKTGPGQMWLNASNTYTGLTLVNEGSLVAFNADALGASGTGTTVNDGASLILNATGTIVHEPIALSGSGDGSHGALNVFGNVTLQNPFPSIFACLDLTTNATIRVEPDGVLTADGFISGIGPLTKSGPGTLVFANANTNSYSGDTIVREGVLELRKPNFAVAVPGDLVIGPAPFNSSATVRFFQDGGMTAGRIVTVNAGSLLDLNGFGQNVVRLNLNDGGDAQTGGGILEFPVGGLVTVGSLSQLGSHASSYLAGNVALPANASLTFAVNAYAPTAPFDFNPELELLAQIAAPAENPNFERAGIAKTGAGTMRLAANNSFNGRVDISEGTLVAARNSALGSTNDGTFVLNNATLALQDNVTITDEILVLNSSAAAALDNLHDANTWAGRIIMNQSSTVRVADASSLGLAGAISGTRHFTKVGPGTLVLSGADPNSYDGETFINEGTLFLNKPFVVTAVPGPLSVGSAAGAATVVHNLNGYQVVGNIFVNRGSLYNVNGQEENVDHLWLYDGGDVQTGTGVLFLKTGGSIRAFPGTDGDPSTISGNLGLDPGQHDIIVARRNFPGPPELIIDALVSQPLTTAGLRKNGDGTLRLTANNTYSGSTAVAAGTLQVDGSQSGSGVSVQSGAQLMGTGRAGAVDFVSLGGSPGVVSPGHSPGILSCGNFNLGGAGGTLRIELNGATPGINGYDQLWVRGALSFATLDGVTLDASLNFASAVNDRFTIVRKDGAGLVTGEFTGLPEGANFYIGGEQFTITYAGGDGNDVVLTRIPTPPRPALVIEAISPSSVRLLWPASFADYTLQFTTNLSGAGWMPTAPPPVVIGTNNVVTNGTGEARRFYRLFKP
jgi:autotransporter-associated beta strand protein